MLLDLIIIIILFRHLKRTLLPPEPTPEWSRILIILIVTASALFLGQSMIKGSSRIIDMAGHLMALSLVVVILNKKEWHAVKPAVNAVLPVIIVQLVRDIADMAFHSFYKKWEGYFDTAAIFALVWMGAIFLQNRKQRKALEKERQKLEEKEKEIKLTEAMKAKLEIQVQERTAELTRQTEELQHTLDELKAAQTQLVHSEKMASLGELTAGIAHEIQNPLNFVNNFSEVSKELLDEMKEAIEKGDTNDAKEIANDVIQNLDKINHHGKRADAIVKGMLQHSRTSSGQKELTDINNLADEYLRLAYHGLRAKDKSFNAKFETDFDTSIGKINIVPQDIGRVILNLINNAFYTVSEKQKQGISGYEPTVTVATKKIAGKIEIRVIDNGNGIPQKVLDKIFQPFFTTKPTGQGTGLGLSLSYDIITKGHSGEIKVETKEGEGLPAGQAGSAFIISLPLKDTF